MADYIPIQKVNTSIQEKKGVDFLLAVAVILGAVILVSFEKK
jgi:hypothetical protein